MLSPSPSAPSPPFPFSSFTALKVPHSIRAPGGGRDSLAKQERDCLPLAARSGGSGLQELADVPAGALRARALPPGLSAGISH